MNYIWINPVVKSMYSHKFESLISELKNKGYMVIEPPSQVDIVKNKFKNTCMKEKKIILDTRCPLSIECINKNIKSNKFFIPDIEPILIHSARVLYDIYIKDNKEDKLFITTPCSSLKDMGNYIFEKEKKCGVIFKTWNDICESLDIKKEKKCRVSPIPLGFFRNLNLKVLEVSGQEKILKAIENVVESDKNINLVEMLLCEGGCNTGDGV